jgi:ketosteroid isomerase-like protein
MSTDQNKTILRRCLEAYRPGNLSALEQLADEYYAADYILHDPDWPDLPPGPAGAKQFARRVYQDAPDTKVTVEDLVAEGDKVASRFTVSSTDAATGKPARYLGMLISRFAGGKIAEEWALGVLATETSTPS